MGAFTSYSVGSRRPSAWLKFKSPLFYLLPFFYHQCAPGGSDSKESACNRPRFDPWVRKIPGERNGYPLQHSYLGNPMDRGTWWDAVHGVARVGHDWAANTIIFIISKVISIHTHSEFQLKVLFPLVSILPVVSLTLILPRDRSPCLPFFSNYSFFFFILCCTQAINLLQNDRFPLQANYHTFRLYFGRPFLPHPLPQFMHTDTCPP